MDNILIILNENIEEVYEEALQFLDEMLRIPTENPPGKNYEQFVQTFEKQLKNMGYQTDLIEVPQNRMSELVKFGEGYRASVVGSKGQGELRIAFNGHYDVVPSGAGWENDPYKPVKDGNYIYGRGSSDMKSGLAMQLFSVKLIEKVFPEILKKVTFIQTAVPDEETVGNKNAGAYYLVEQGILSKNNVNFIIYTEPLGSNNICFGHRGAIFLMVRVKGVKSHGSMPFLGKDAVFYTTKIISKLYDYADSKSMSITSNYNIIPEGAKKPSLAIGTVKCGTWANTVADECEFSVYRRLIPEEKLNDVRSELLNIMNSVEKPNGVELEIDEKYATDSILENTENAYYKSLELAIREVTGKDANLVLSPGTFDIRFTNAIDVPGLNYGPGTLEQAHVSNEKLSLEDFKKSIIITALGLYNMALNVYK